MVYAFYKQCNSNLITLVKKRIMLVKTKKDKYFPCSLCPCFLTERKSGGSRVREFSILYLSNLGEWEFLYSPKHARSNIKTPWKPPKLPAQRKCRGKLRSYLTDGPSTKTADGAKHSSPRFLARVRNGIFWREGIQSLRQIVHELSRRARIRIKVIRIENDTFPPHP